MLLLWLLLRLLLMLIRTPSIILVGNDMLGMRARMWRDEDTIYFYVCAFDHRLCVYEDVLKRCVLKRCMQMWHFTLERDLTRTSKILALMSTHLVQRRKKQLFYVCFNLCFKEMWWYMCNVKFYALRARSRRRYQYMLKYYYNHVKDNFINFKTSWTTRISLNSSTVEILFFH